VGTASCGQWLADDKNQNNIMRNTELSWVLGWLSATSAFMGVAGGHLRHTDANAVAAWVDKYCREHPLEPIYGAATGLVGELAKPQ
jgi:hypothetical protein